MPLVKMPPRYGGLLGRCSEILLKTYAIAVSSSRGTCHHVATAPLGASYPFSCNGFDPNYNRQNCLKVEFSKALRSTAR